MEKMLLYHTGFEEIPVPDISRGRKNADFGQGFYLTPDRDFSRTWASERKGCDTIINEYELDTEDLCVKEFTRSMEWFEYIFHNRRSARDTLRSFDLICGPIANDIIYDVMGIITSGYLTAEESLKLLMVGPEYRQVVIKTPKALSRLHWTGSQILPGDEIAQLKKQVRKQEQEYQKLLAREMEHF